MKIGRSSFLLPPSAFLSLFLIPNPFLSPNSGASAISSQRLFRGGRGPKETCKSSGPGSKIIVCIVSRP